LKGDREVQLKQDAPSVNSGVGRADQNNTGSEKDVTKDEDRAWGNSTVEVRIFLLGSCGRGGQRDQSQCSALGGLPGAKGSPESTSGREGAGCDRRK